MYLKICLKFKLIMLVSMFGIIGCVHSKDDSDIKIAMLKEFYISYNSIWGSDSDFGIIVRELDSMRQKYCTEKFILELNEEVESHGYDHDILTGDLSADENYLQDISIVKDSLMKNWYIVSYKATIEANSKPEKIEVKLQVEVIKEDDKYKINDVKPMH